MKQGSGSGLPRSIDAVSLLPATVFLLVPHLAWVGLSDYGLLKDLSVFLTGLLWVGIFMNGRTLVRLGSTLWPWGWIPLASLSLPLAWASDPAAGFGQLFVWAVLALFGMLSGQMAAHVPERGQGHLRVIALSVCITCGIAGAQLLGLLDWPGQTRAPAATFSNRNVAAHWLVAAWPAAVMAWAAMRSASGGLGLLLRLAVLVPIVWVPLTLLLSGSKAGVAAILLEALVIGWLSGRCTREQISPLWRRAGVSGLVIIALGMGALMAWQYGAKRMESAGGERFWRSTLAESVNTRWNASLSAMRMVMDRPLGVGAGQFERVYPLYESSGSGWAPSLTRRQGALHNDWLQWIAEGGWVMVPLFSLALFAYIRALWRFRTQQRRAVPADPLAVFAYGGLAGLGLLGFVSFPFQSGLIFYSAFFMMGILSHSGRGEPDALAVIDPWSQRPRVRMARCAVAAGLFLLFGWLAVRQVVADGLFYRQAGAFARGDSAQVKQLGSAVLKWWPRHEMGADLMGRSYLQEGAFTVAEDTFRHLRARAPHDPAYTYHESLALAGLGRHGEALALIEPLAQRYPGSPALQFLLGTQRFALSDFNRAYVAFHEAARLEPRNWLYAHNTGVAAERAGWNDLAMDAYVYALRIEPERRLTRERLEALRGRN